MTAPQQILRPVIPDAPHRSCVHFRRILFALAMVPALGAAAPVDLVSDALQEVQLAARVLHFQQPPLMGTMTIALVYSASDAGSHDEAAALSAALVDSPATGDLHLRPILIEQAHLGESSYNAVITASGVDAVMLGAALKQRQIVCLTKHLSQVEHGACVVAIRSLPRVSIIVNTANALAAGVQFATAFRMMVQEL